MYLIINYKIPNSRIFFAFLFVWYSTVSLCYFIAVANNLINHTKCSNMKTLLILKEIKKDLFPKTDKTWFYLPGNAILFFIVSKNIITYTKMGMRMAFVTQLVFSVLCRLISRSIEMTDNPCLNSHMMHWSVFFVFFCLIRRKIVGDDCFDTISRKKMLRFPFYQSHV